MKAAKFSNVDEIEDPLKTPGPAKPGVAWFITEEIQAAARSVHETFWAPLSYPTSAPLLSSTPSDDDIDREAHQPPSPPPLPELPMTLWDWTKFAITMGATMAWMVGTGVSIGIGVDPLAFSMLAFFLNLALIYFVVMCSYLQTCIFGKLKKAEPVPLTPETRRQRVNSIMAVSFAFLGIWIMFIGIVWGWAFMGPDNVWHLYEEYKVSRAIQAKIDAPHALGSLVQCLQRAIPERNATIVDIETCLRAMGMKESYVPNVVV